MTARVAAIGVEAARPRRRGPGRLRRLRRAVDSWRWRPTRCPNALASSRGMSRGRHWGRGGDVSEQLFSGLFRVPSRVARSRTGGAEGVERRRSRLGASEC